MKIYLIRHGKTEANEKHLYCGSTDLPLSEQGRKELAAEKNSPQCLNSEIGKKREDFLEQDIKKKNGFSCNERNASASNNSEEKYNKENTNLRAETITNNIDGTRFITSGMRRTNETLKILFGDVPFEIDERFREIDFGIFEMKSYEELKNQPEYQKWLEGDNEANVPPNGESGAQMQKRVLEALEDVIKSGQDTVIVSHGGVIAAIMQSLFQSEKKHRYEWQPEFGHGYVVELAENSYERI